jgi:putative tryptophan/tyrosine transport system substrate-binding protein
MAICIRRREFIVTFGGMAAAWPLASYAQQPERMRRIGVLNGLVETDAEVQSWDAAFRKRLDELGWVEGRNIHMDYRWGAASVERMHLFATELTRLNPDVLFTATTPATAAMQQETHTIPIVFAAVSDPVGSGFIASLASPGGNITGFVNLEASLSGKWLELMREIAPQVSRVAFMFNPNTAPYARYYLDTFRSAASALAVEAIEAPIRNSAEIEAFMTKLGHEAGAALVVMSDTFTSTYREPIISLADRYRLPTIYPFRYFVTDGGLMSYGIVVAEMFRGAASYVDRILRGAKPNELPVQLPTRFELIINLKAAKALGLAIPPALLARADEVIE